MAIKDKLPDGIFVKVKEFDESENAIAELLVKVYQKGIKDTKKVIINNMDRLNCKLIVGNKGMIPLDSAKQLVRES